MTRNCSRKRVILKLKKLCNCYVSHIFSIISLHFFFLPIRFIIIVTGVSSFFAVKYSVTKQRVEAMKSRERMRYSNFGNYETTRKFS